ncbi:hypothetical protein ACVME5_006630 [Bradyrhizobium liaoningense]
MIGFWVVNLLIPGEPEALDINTPSGTWRLERAAFYDRSKEAILEGKCARTYALEHPVSMGDGAAACDAAFEEVTPLLLGASYLTALSVTSDSSVPHSSVQMMQVGSHWPRERSMGHGNPVVGNPGEFVASLEAFVRAWPTAGHQEKARLLIHHWLDGLACWSFEDLYLSATTLLQVIAATEERVQNRDLSFYNGVTGASNRAGVTPLSQDFKDMRNVLIHEGSLIGGSFRGTSLQDCTNVVADVLNWFDEYLHSVLSLGPVRRKRFKASDFLGLNAYSI